MKHLSTFFIFMGIWFAASLLNGLLSGIYLGVFDNSQYGNGTLGLSVFFSFVFSIPFVGAVWMVTTIAHLAGKKGYALFQVALGATVICAFAGALFFISAFNRDFNNSRYAVAAAILISAVSAVLLFRSPLKAAFGVNEETVSEKK